MEVVSGLGDGAFWIGLAAVLIDRGVGPGGLAVAVLARLAPRALISAPAGVLADRVDRRRLLVSLDLARGVLMAVLAVAAAAGARPWLLLLVVTAGYTLAAPYRPALTAALPLVAGEDRLSSANALIGTVRQLMTFVGPVAGAVIVRVWSPTVAFWFDAVSFAVAAALLAGVNGLDGRPRGDSPDIAGHRAAWLREIGDGWREVTATPGLVVVVVLVFAMYVARGAEVMLFVLVADQHLGFGAAGIGVLTGAVGFGALCALPVAGRVAEAERTAFWMTVSVATTAAPLAVLALVRSPAVAFVDLAVLGAGVVAFEVISIVSLQRLTRRQALGRVFGLVGTASNAGKLAGALVAPALVAAVGLGASLVSIGVLVAVVGLAAVPALIALSRASGQRRRQLSPIVDVLARLGVFEAAPRSALEMVAAAVEPERFPAGSTVVRQGDPADDLFVVRDGDFVVLDGDRTINTMGPSDWFGEIGLLQRRLRTATVVATTDALVWRIPGPAFLSALSSSSAPPAALIDVMADRLARSELPVPASGDGRADLPAPSSRRGRHAG